MIEKIRIKNLTVFENLEINTNYPINVFIGENGVGKTQLLKFIYTTFPFFEKDPRDGRYKEPVSRFGTLLGLQRNEELQGSKVEVFCNSIPSVQYTLSTVEELRESENKKFNLQNTQELLKVRKNLVFIPSNDMLTYASGLLSMKEKYGDRMPFDINYLDIVKKALAWTVTEIPEIAKSIIPILEEQIDGKVIVVDERFFIEKFNGKKIPFNHEAEGLKKIGLLWQLLMNESITKETILLWDEPEANLNPNQASIIADTLLELSRSGVQVFLSTHSYFLAKYFDILEKEKEEVVFHSMYRENDKKDSPVVCETSDTFSMLTRNDIIDEKIRIYEIETEWEF